MSMTNINEASGSKGKYTSTEASSSYSNWMGTHPSALENLLPELKAHLKRSTVVVFLDYDGTLSAIVDNPDEAHMTTEMRSTLRKVASKFSTSIVTGRSKETIKNFVRMNNICYAGSHGKDIVIPGCMLPNNIEINYQPVLEFKEKILEVKAILKKEISNIEGASVEDSRFAISVHYRNVNSKFHDRVEQIAKSVHISHPGDFKVNGGKMVWEINPNVAWGKGEAVKFILDKLELKGGVIAFYIGDDSTDEPAFETMNHLKDGKAGYSIVVSDIPKTTFAKYSLLNPIQVQGFLVDLAESG